ncbi:MAG TPA: winged helix-turn-helix domain-containing protein [Rhodanobacter sp.]
MTKQKKSQTYYITWMGPVLNALRALGGSASPRDVSGHIARTLHLPPEITDATLKSGANRFHNQVQWARQYLVWEGLLDDTTRGRWALGADPTWLENASGRRSSSPTGQFA